MFVQSDVDQDVAFSGDTLLVVRIFSSLFD